MRPLRIAFVGVRDLPGMGGVESHMAALERRLAGRGHAVTTYVRVPHGSRGRGGAPPGASRSYRPTIPGKHLEAGLHSLLCSVEAALRPYDVVHYHGIGPSLFCPLPRLAGRRVVATIHARDDERPKWGRLASAVLRAGERCARRYAHRTIAIAPALAGSGARRSVVIPNGVDIEPPAEPRTIGARWGLIPDGYVLSLGRWTREKRVHELVEAWGAVEPAGVRLVVAGDGPKDIARVVRGSAGAGVLLPGRVGGRVKRELLDNARGFVTFSSLEGQPIALLEAMAARRACLGSPIRAHAALLADGRGLLHPADTPRERAEALRALLALAPEARRALGEAARAHVSAEHDWDRIVDRLEALYAELLPCAS